METILIVDIRNMLREYRNKAEEVGKDIGRYSEAYRIESQEEAKALQYVLDLINTALIQGVK